MNRAQTPISASVILCTRNRAARLPEALRALAAMQLRAGVEWEVLVVDNGSTDGTRQVVERFAAAGQPRFRYLYEGRAGKTYALNHGIAQARADLLAFTDDDAIVDRRWLQTIVDAMAEHGVDGIGGRVRPLWDGPRPAWLTDRFLNVLAVLDCGDEVIRLDYRRAPRILYGVNFAFRRSVFERIGGFDTRLGSRGEDQELFDRLKAVNAAVIYHPGVIVGHQMAVARLTRAYYRQWYLDTGRTRTRVNPYKGPAILGVPLYALKQGVLTALRTLKGLASRDTESAFAEYLTLHYWMGFCSASLRRTLLPAAGGRQRVGPTSAPGQRPSVGR